MDFPHTYEGNIGRRVMSELSKAGFVTRENNNAIFSAIYAAVTAEKNPVRAAPVPSDMYSDLVLGMPKTKKPHWWKGPWT